MDSGLDVVSLAERPDLVDAHEATGGAAWPEFMLHDPVAIASWGRLLADFAGFQLLLLDGGEIVALVNTLPLRLPEPGGGALPDRGVDWGVEEAIRGLEAEVAPDALMGVQVVIPEARRGRGLSAVATAEMLGLARRRGFGELVVPLRPGAKADYPLIPMADYARWRRADGLPFDGWLRVHARAGGAIEGVCAESMRIAGTVDEWRRWTGLAFPGSGRYLVPGALVPVQIDLDRDEGLYVEPNVWVRHRIGGMAGA